MLKEEKKFKYIEKGEDGGDPIILLHGLMGAMSNFDTMIDFLSKNGFKVLLPELPLFEYNLLQTNVVQLKNFVEKFVKHKELEEFHLVGNSLGGHIALLYARKNPKQVKSLTLMGSSGLFENAFGNSFPRREDKNYIRAKIDDVFHNKAVITEQLVDEVYEALNNRIKVIKTIAISKSAMRHNMENELANMKLPVCLIWGKNDKVTPQSAALRFSELLPNSELFWIDECGHVPMMEHPDLSNEIFINWYKKHFSI